MSRRHDTASKTFTSVTSEPYDVRGYSDAYITATETGTFVWSILGAVESPGTFIELYEKYTATAIKDIAANDAVTIDLRGVGFLKLDVTAASGTNVVFELGFYEE